MSRIILSVRFQLAGAIILGSFLPSLARKYVGFDFFSTQNSLSTLIGTTLAIVAGYFFHRQLAVYPGVKADFYIIPTFAAAFFVMILVFFLARFDYTRATLISSFLVTIAWFHFLGFATRRVRPYSLAIVPGGEVNSLLAIPDARWVMLTEPEMPRRTWNGLVADLHADLSDQWVRFISEAAVSGIPVFHEKQIRESLTGRVEIAHLSENTLGSLNPNAAYRELKHTLDFLGAFLALIVLLPVFAVVAVLIKLDTKGTVLFLQERKGYRGAIFKVYKFRTMIASDPIFSDDEDETRDAREQARTKRGDMRITRVGRFLRRTRLDELPQIVNILRGEMSWIGPRPEARVLAEWYESELSFYNYRHIVHPGITGWAQVNQGHVSAVEDVLSKLHYDFYYIKNFSFWLDMLIIMRTIKTVLTGFGSK